jgi:hypothetical protein
VCVQYLRLFPVILVFLPFVLTAPDRSRCFEYEQYRAFMDELCGSLVSSASDLLSAIDDIWTERNGFSWVIAL